MKWTIVFFCFLIVAVYSFEISFDVNDTSTDDDWEDRRYLQQRWRPPKRCRLITEVEDCVKHKVCCYNKLHGCWKCIDEET